MDFNLTSIIQGDLVNVSIRIFAIGFLILFILYSLLTVRQVSIMNHSLVTKLAVEIQLLSFLQLGLGIIALLAILFFS